MAKPSGADWHLDPSEVHESRDWYRHSTRSGKVARTSRAQGTQYGHMTLRHVATGIEVEGTVEAGQYTRKEMLRHMDELRSRLWAQLEQRVARHLRLPGR